MKIVSPTGLGIRHHDEWGSGLFRASRGDKLHNGADFMLCKPGEILEVGRPVYAPVGGKVIREVFPYGSGSRYRGLLIANEFGDFMMFYLAPFPRILHIGYPVRAGEEIGLAQDISKRKLPDKYPGMTPHIHLRIKIHGAHLLSGKPEYIDPMALMQGK